MFQYAHMAQSALSASPQPWSGRQKPAPPQGWQKVQASLWPAADGTAVTNPFADGKQQVSTLCTMGDELITRSLQPS